MGFIESFFIENDESLVNDVDTIKILNEMSVEDILEGIELSYSKIKPINKENISQFSNIDAIENVLTIVQNAIEPVDFVYVGYMLNKNTTIGAQRKYGENHLKMAVQMGLISQKPYRVTKLGETYLKLEYQERKKVKPKMYLRVPIIQRLLLGCREERVSAMEELRKPLAEKTAIRRRTSIKTLISQIEEISGIELQKKIMDNIYWS